MAYNFKTNNQVEDLQQGDTATSEDQLNKQTRNKFIPISNHILKILELIRTDTANSSIYQEYFNELSAKHRKKVEGAMQQNRYLSMGKKIHNPDGFYIEEDYFETWMAENNKSLASSGSLTLSSRGAIDTIDL
tara:strand:+ start:41 stop:439 length:399 start_codon:yes stop_codon:yes gene_type:complete